MDVVCSVYRDFGRPAVCCRVERLQGSWLVSSSFPSCLAERIYVDYLLLCAAPVAFWMYWLLKSGYFFLDALAAPSWIWSGSFGWIRCPGLLGSLVFVVALQETRPRAYFRGRFLLPFLICLVLGCIRCSDIVVVV